MMCAYQIREIQVDSTQEHFVLPEVLASFAAD